MIVGTQPAGTSWLAVEEDDDLVLVTAAGGIAASRAEELWCAIEAAVDRSVGRLVAVDLTRVTAFDEHSVHEVLLVARDSLRRHLDLCAITAPDSPLGHQLRHRLPERFPVYPSLSQALCRDGGG
jgi:anti-anti-sigma regulatory factor